MPQSKYECQNWVGATWCLRFASIVSCLCHGDEENFGEKINSELVWAQLYLKSHIRQIHGLLFVSLFYSQDCCDFF